MAGPSWLADVLAGIMILTAAYCVTRLAAALRQHRPTQYDLDAVHVLMGVAMAGMLVSRLRIFWTGGWEIVFGAAAGWFAWRAAREFRGKAAGRRHSHHLQHVLACAAMLYVFLVTTSTAKAASGGSAADGMAGGGHLPTLALVLAVGVLGYVVWTADRLPALARVTALAAAGAPAPARVTALAVPGTPAPAPALARAGVPMSPRLSAGCEIAMGITMGYMLIVML